jgi:hypothetical protein
MDSDELPSEECSLLYPATLVIGEDLKLKQQHASEPAQRGR